MKNETIIGVISDTHGKLDGRINEIFSNVDYILHAGDIGDGGTVLMELEAIAPLYAVRGNCDIGPNTYTLPFEMEVKIADVAIYMTHAYECIDPVKAERAQLVIFGHNHYPEIHDIGNTKYLNPGSASHGRNKYPCSVALVKLTQDGIDVDIVEVKS